MKTTPKTIREEFSKSTKQIIASRSGYRCSYPDCNKTLIGPGEKNDKFIMIGKHAHIFSAKPGGPRGDGGLSKEQIKRPENGIFLCANHHDIIDKKDEFHHSGVLIRFKSRHEFLISAELGEYLYPLNWLNTVKITESSLFNSTIELNLGKLTHFYGDYGSGKTTLCELLFSCFQQKIVKRWIDKQNYFQFEVTIDNPVINKFNVEIKAGMLSYIVETARQSFVPYDYFVVFLKNKLKNKTDDISRIADCFNLERNFIKSILLNNTINGITTQNYVIKSIRENPYPVDELYVDVGNNIQQRFSSCSDSEEGRILMDIAISLASTISKYKSVLLIIDWINISALDTVAFNPYLDYLLSPKARFQTIFVSPDKMDSLDWNGWEIAQFRGRTPNTKIIQNRL
jgi:energy-coupling factor transporter ATP-binding protein EcfA2